MSDLKQKISNYQKSVQRLKEALAEYDANQNPVIRDGAIQRFEFCAELAWKTTRAYLMDQGFTGIDSPKAVMREAYAFQVIDAPDTWVQILNDRNLTSHVYDETTANAIFRRICETHTAALSSLSDFFSSLRSA